MRCQLVLSPGYHNHRLPRHFLLVVVADILSAGHQTTRVRYLFLLTSPRRVSTSWRLFSQVPKFLTPLFIYMKTVRVWGAIFRSNQKQIHMKLNFTRHRMRAELRPARPWPYNQFEMILAWNRLRNEIVALWSLMDPAAGRFFPIVYKISVSPCPPDYYKIMLLYIYPCADGRNNPPTITSTQGVGRRKKVLHGDNRYSLDCTHTHTRNCV